MESNITNLENLIFQYIDKVKVLFSPETWQNILMDCSKNELFILLLLYRQNESNMTQLAEYVGVPLNTATGIVARMEKKGIVIRERSPEDKRIVTICLTKEGKACIQSIMKTFLHYGGLILESFSAEETQILFQLLDKGVKVLTTQQKLEQDKADREKVRKITID